MPRPTARRFFPVPVRVIVKMPLSPAFRYGARACSACCRSKNLPSIAQIEPGLQLHNLISMREPDMSHPIARARLKMPEKDVLRT
jgi:hypothetical protein